jgi:hypothetical protein
MISLEYCIEHAPELAAEVTNAWAVHEGSAFTLEFKTLLDAADKFLSAHQTMDPQERAVRETFCKVYKEYRDKGASGLI